MLYENTKMKNKIKEEVLKIKEGKLELNPEQIQKDIERNVEYAYQKGWDNALQKVSEVLDKEFIKVEEGSPKNVASVVYVFKQVIKQKLGIK